MRDAYEGSEPYIFVSYSHRDRDRVLPIIDSLQREGYRVWYDAGIKAGEEWNEYIAKHVRMCRCMLALLTPASVESRYCKEEMNYAYDLGKRMLFVRLDPVELTPGMEMRFLQFQHVLRYEYSSYRAFIADLLKVEILAPCLSEASVRRPEVEELVGEAKALLTSHSTDVGRLQLALQGLRVLSSDERDSEIDQLIWRLVERIDLLEHMGGGLERQDSPVTGRERNALQKVGGQQGNQKANGPGAQEVPEADLWRSVEIGEAEARRILDDIATMPARDLPASGGSSLTQDLLDKYGQVRMPKGGLANVPMRNLAEYSWDELKRIAERIAAAGTEDEWRWIARHYLLLGQDDKLHGDTIPLKLTDGTQTSIRIAGFRHDELADGNGRRAGITFEFADVPARHSMNPEWTNSGGWEKSEMRRWLNGDFRKLLPSDLSSNIAQVKKRTNNRGGDVRNDVRAVTETTDSLWLLSMSEVYGKLTSQSKNVPSYPGVYDAEGIQYQLYADQMVSTTDYSFCVKKENGASSWWWLRSPSALNSINFLYVYSNGDWINGYAGNARGVSPGFCF